MGAGIVRSEKNNVRNDTLWEAVLFDFDNAVSGVCLTQSLLPLVTVVYVLIPPRVKAYFATPCHTK